VTKLIIHNDTARQHPTFMADLEAAGCDIDLLRRPRLRDPARAPRGPRRITARRHRPRRTRLTPFAESLESGQRDAIE
jgi:hypothetical protein